MIMSFLDRFFRSNFLLFFACRRYGHHFRHFVFLITLFNLSFSLLNDAFLLCPHYLLSPSCEHGESAPCHQAQRKDDDRNHSCNSNGPTNVHILAQSDHRLFLLFLNKDQHVSNSILPLHTHLWVLWILHYQMQMIDRLVPPFVSLICLEQYLGLSHSILPL